VLEEEIVEEISEQSSEASTSEAEEEYSVEEVGVELKEFRPSDVELMLKKSEIWDKLVRGEISVDEAKRLMIELSGTVTAKIEAGSTSRRRRRS